MIDDDGIDPGDETAPFGRTYDFYKYLTGIALISIGAVLAFLDDAGVQLDPKRVIFTLLMLGISGVASLMIAAYLSGLEVRPVARATIAKRVRLGGAIAIGSLLVGLGAFMQTFGSAMLR